MFLSAISEKRALIAKRGSGQLMRAIIVCNGSMEDYSFYKNLFEATELVICADGGAYHLKRLGVVPDILLGDFDSIRSEDLEYFRENGVQIIKYPKEKDMTDTELAVEYAIEKGCSEVVIIGGLGTRLDHSLSNVFLLKKMLDCGVKGTIINETNEITIINRTIKLRREPGYKVTLLPLTESVEGVTTKGLYYPLKGAKIDLGSTWGVSNEFEGETAEITIDKGLMLVIKSRD